MPIRTDTWAGLHISKLIQSLTNARHDLTNISTNLVCVLFYSDFTCRGKM